MEKFPSTEKIDQTESENRENLSVVEEQKNYEMAPEGWVTRGKLAEELDIQDKKVEKIKNGYLKENPDSQPIREYRFRREWKGKFIPGRIESHYSPELSDYIRGSLKKEEEQYLEAPEGWLTASSLSKNLDTSFAPIKMAAEESRESNPDWFKDYKDKGGKISEHYSPQLVENIENKFFEHEKAPEGWITNGAIAKRVNISRNSVGRIADQYRAEYPEWFKNYRHQTRGRIIEHYSPELVKLLENELSKYEFAPEGWIVNSRLADNLGAGFSFVEKIANKYRDNHPGWFKIYKPKMGGATEHYTPELVENIQKEFLDQEIAPEGWLTSNALSVEIGENQATVRKVANFWRENNPEWFKLYKNKKGGQIFEFYAPPSYQCSERKIF